MSGKHTGERLFVVMVRRQKVREGEPTSSKSLSLVARGEKRGRMAGRGGFGKPPREKGGGEGGAERKAHVVKGVVKDP